MRLRVGIGYDAHRLAPRRELRLGGIQVPYERGLSGHSDGDVLLHAVTDALLGAVALGDMGRHFPSQDPKWAGAASRIFLERALELVRERGYRVVQIDAVVIAEEPRLAPFCPAMSEAMAAMLDIPPDRVGVKAKTTDGMGAIGRGEGIAAQAVALLEAVEA